MPTCLAALFAAVILTNVTDVSDAVRRRTVGVAFQLEGIVTFSSANTSHFAISNHQGNVALRNVMPDRSRHTPPVGSFVHAVGKTESNYERAVVANCHDLQIVGGHPRPLSSVMADIPDIKAGSFDSRVVRVRGTIRESFRDEIDPIWTYFVLRHDGESIYVVFPSGANPNQGMGKLTDAEVSLVGLCCPFSDGHRQVLGRHIQIASLDAVTVLRESPADPFGAPLLSQYVSTAPEDIMRMGRHRVCGYVLASWHGDRTLIQTDEGDVLTIELTVPPPPFGVRIEAVGFPITDLYRINLGTAVWRQIGTDRTNAPEASRMEIKGLFADDIGRPKLNLHVHGKAHRFKGLVQSLPTADSPDTEMTLACDGCTLAVAPGDNTDAFAGLSVGCTVEVSGTCVVETENWWAYAPFPHARRILLVLRQPGDVVVLARPPWWTPARLLIAIAALILILALILLWNVSLRIVARRRGRELFKENVAHISADLRRDERTRLAVELHDSIAQNLTGVSLQLDSGNPGLARKTLESCREELRNCLWDLRNQTLEDDDLGQAIVRTLEPHLDGVGLSIRFNVRRSKLSDSTAHAVLRIIRELTVNAIRHGHARHIWIAGGIDRDRILFSVRDNGCGYDPTHCPGVAEGHFGLQGIHERVGRFNGTIDVQSSPDAGTKTTVTLKRQQ